MHYGNNTISIEEKIEEKIGMGEYVEVTDGRNGYPENVHKALTFATRSEAGDFASENDLQLSLLRKRDGWSLYENCGCFDMWTDGNLGIEDFDYNEGHNVYEIKNLADLENMLAKENEEYRGIWESEYDEDDEFAELYEFEPIVAPDWLLESISSFRKGDVIAVEIVEGKVSYACSFNIDDAKWHDSDVWTYQIAVEV